MGNPLDVAPQQFSQLVDSSRIRRHQEQGINRAFGFL